MEGANEFIKATVGKLLLIFCNLLLVILGVTITCIQADKVFVGCVKYLEYGVYAANYGGNHELHFRRIIDLEGAPLDITHDPNTDLLYIIEDYISILKADATGGGKQTVLNWAWEHVYELCIGNNILFWTAEDGIYKLDLIAGTSTANKISSCQPQKRCIGIESNRDGTHIYWANYKNGTVQRAALDGSGQSTVLSGLEDVDRITFDDTGKLYAASLDGRIVQHDLDTDASVFVDIYSMGPYTSIQDITVLDDLLIVVEYFNGIIAIPKNGGEPLTLNITGLKSCTDFHSIHVMKGTDTPSVSPSVSPSIDTQDKTTVSQSESEVSDEQTTVSQSSNTQSTSISSEFTTKIEEVSTSEFYSNGVPESSATLSPSVLLSTFTQDTTTISTNERESTNEQTTVSQLPDTCDDGLLDTCVNDLLEAWEIFCSIFPEMIGNMTRMQTRKTDTEIFTFDRLIKESWKIEVTGDNEAYNFKIMFPENAWRHIEGYHLVTSVLKLPLNVNVTVNNSTFIFGSHVFSITMFNSTNDIVPYTAEKEFNITIRLLPNVMGQPVCHYLAQDSEWLPDGCNTSVGDDNQVTCSCNHMTSFAVLMQLEEIEIPISHQKALTYLTYIGISTSILCLVATIVLFVICKLYKNIRIAIHINLAVSLLLAQLLFVTGVNSKDKGACIAVAAMLHYFWLVVFMWMLVEGTHLYLKVNPNITWRTKLPICMPIAWGLPAILAFMTLGVSLGAGLSEYAKSGRCWLTVDGGLVFAFVVPALCITLVNLVILIIVIYKFLNLKTNQDKSEIERIKASVRAMAILVPLLGITWVFGVLQFDQTSTIVFSYLFDICNGIQGVFIFITQCLLDDDVKCFLKQKASRGQVDNSNSTSVT